MLNLPLFLVERRIGQPDREAARRQHVIGRRHRSRATGVDIDRDGRIHRIDQAFERDPRAAVTRQRPAQQTEIEKIRNPGRIQHWDQGVDHRGFAVRGQRRGFAVVIVAEQHQHAAMARRAGCIRMAQRVACPVDAWRLAVPHGEDAIVLGARKQVHLLRSPHGGGREVFVQARFEVDVMGTEVLLRLLELLVKDPKRRAAIAGDEARRVQSRFEIALALQKREPNECVRAVQIDPAVAQRVFVFKRYRHAALSSLLGFPGRLDNRARLYTI